MHSKAMVIQSASSSPDIVSLGKSIGTVDPTRGDTGNRNGDDETDDETANTWNEADGDANGNGMGNTLSLTWHPRSQQSPNWCMEKRMGQDETDTDPRWWKFRARGFDDDKDQDWWFASTGIPLLAATLGPMANMLSIGALVTYWRMDLQDAEGNKLPELSGIPFKDPPWAYWLNVGSLICGFVGNIFLLFNFTGRVRYILALPATIFSWSVATGILVGITTSMHIYAPPISPLQTYTQGFWYGVMAAVLYFMCFGLLMINMLGYFLGHYPQRFLLTDHQRTLILQTMLFFIWLAGGAAVFARIEQNRNPDHAEDWAFVDALYFCDVTILTIGFGDLYPRDNLGRGLVFPFSVGGIIMLGLVISSLHKFASELGEDNIVKKHIQRERSKTFERSVTESSELRHEGDGPHPKRIAKDLRKLHISAPFNPRRGDRRSSIYAPQTRKYNRSSSHSYHFMIPMVKKHTNVHELLNLRKPKLILLKEERDRFNAMRNIQKSTARFKRWWALSMSIVAFSILWLVGAVVFWSAERIEQGMTYFQALYFCYVSLLTIGYGDLAPKSNVGRCFFVFWSLIAVPTMTILISAMSDTVIDGFKNFTFRFADFTVLPQKGVWKEFLDSHPMIVQWYKRQVEKRRERRRIKHGIPFPSVESELPTISVDDDIETPGDGNAPTIEALATEAERDASKPLDEGRLARRLAIAIRNVAADLRSEKERHYTYEEWVELTRLIRFTSEDPEHALKAEEDMGMVEWDWIGENSPLMSGLSETEFVLDRLCESLTRYVRRAEHRRRRSVPGVEREESSPNDDSDRTPHIADSKNGDQSPLGSPSGREKRQDDGGGFRAGPPMRTVTKEELFGDQSEVDGRDFGDQPHDDRPSLANRYNSRRGLHDDEHVGPMNERHGD